jgi:hypothetical protein
MVRAMMQTRPMADGPLAVVRRIAERLAGLRTSRAWRSIATREHLARSLGTLAAELQQAQDERASESAVREIIAEILVVAAELSHGIAGELLSVVDREISHREKLANALDDVPVSRPVGAADCGHTASTALVRAGKVSTTRPIY